MNRFEQIARPTMMIQPSWVTRFAATIQGRGEGANDSGVPDQKTPENCQTILCQLTGAALRYASIPAATAASRRLNLRRVSRGATCSPQ